MAKKNNKTDFRAVFSKWWFPVVFSLSVVFFIALRIQPLLNHMVPYTYDQGRDMLQAAKIILDKKPTFLGPTTGVTGMFHGAWWYYVLVVPFLLFKGSPIGFYFFNFALQFGVFLVLAYFLLRYFNKTTTALVALLIATSPYFQMTSVFIGNNIMVLPALLAFALLSYVILHNQQKSKNTALWVFFPLGISLGLVAEFELSFGMFLIPLFFMGTLLFKDLRSALLKFRPGILFGLGLFIAFSMRIFFEIRHEFLQTKTLIGFFIKPHLYNPKPYWDVIQDRIVLFKGYYEGLSANPWILALLSVLLIYLIVAAFKKHSGNSPLKFYVFILGGLFFLSTFYKDNFWANYYEGIHLLFLVVLSILLYRATDSVVKKFLTATLIVVMTLTGFTGTVKSFKSVPETEGLIKMEKVVDYISSQVKSSNKEYCVKVYTPPVIPYTYDYLFLHRKLTEGLPQPQTQWVNNRCWFVLERDDFEERRTKWMNDQGLDRSVKLRGITIVDTDIGYYEIR
ncbi:MAG: hypothetical protein WC775_03235 [Patescibacteria group bacterium]|jgi:hypothetical protein